MFGIAVGATDANLALDEDLNAAISGAAEGNTRAVKVDVDATNERLKLGHIVPATDSAEEDFKAVSACCEDAVPCLVLVRLVGVEGAADDDWALIAWTPSGAPVKLRMLCAASRKTMRLQFPSIIFKEYDTTEREEVSLANFLDHTRALTEEDRQDAMTFEERQLAQVKADVAKEQASQPKMLAGLAALRIKADDSFEEGMRQVLEEASQKAVVGHLNGEVLTGEVLDGVASASSLQGRLPAAEACYVVLRRKPGQIILISWLPDDAGVKLKMKCSTFKASVKDLVRDIAGDNETVRQAELSEESELCDDRLCTDEEESKAAAPAAPASGFKPPPGAMALPGMGAGGGFRPPPGGQALPGMGAGMPKLAKTAGANDKSDAEKAELAAAAAAAAEKAEKAKKEAALEEERKEEEEAARKKKEEEAARKKAEEEAARKKEEEAARQKAEEAARKKAEEDQKAEAAAKAAAAAAAAAKAAAPAPAPAPAATPAAPAAAAAAPVAVAEAATSAQGNFFTMEELQDPSIWKSKGVDAGSRETYLSDAEFLAAFGMSKGDFAKLPGWKRTQKKKEKNLF